MSRRFLTFRRIRSFIWDFIIPAAFLYISYSISTPHPTLSKVFAVCAIIDAFVSGLKIGYIYHRWYIRPQDDYNESTSHD